MRRWLADVINAERVLGSRRLETVDGWPFDLIEADAPPRLVAIYHLGDYIAAAVIDGQASPSVVEVLTKARPDWSTDEILALSEIWSRP